MESASALCTRALDPIDADHSEIVKPLNQSSPAYVAFKFAYQDAKISELKTRLDTKLQTRMISDIKEIAQFPNKMDGTAHKTIMEGLYNDKRPEMLFNLLSSYNQDDINSVRTYGHVLSKFKINYYNYQEQQYILEQMLVLKIGTMVSVRFRKGLEIYLNYFLLRLTNPQQTIISEGNFLDYDITWNDAERVYAQLSSDVTISAQVMSLSNLRIELVNQAQEIMTTVQ